MRATYLIPDSNLASLEAELDRLNKRAKRLSMPAIEMEKAVSIVYHGVLTDRGGTKWITTTPQPNDTPTGETRILWSVTITGTEPKIGGWTFAGTLTPVEVNGGSRNMILAVPGIEIPPDVSSQVGTCDHCNTFRHRKDTFILRNNSGEFKVVGKNCLADFCGHGDPHAIAKWCELLSTAAFADCCGDPDEPGGWGPRPDSHWDVQTVLRLSWALCQKYGFTPKSDLVSDNVPTAHRARFLLTSASRSEEAAAELASLRDLINRSQEPVDQAMQWLSSLDLDDLSDYMLNIALIVQSGFVTERQIGLAVSIIAAHSRHLDRERERTERSNTPSHHIGKIGERVELAVVVDRVIPRESDWGVTYICGMRAFNPETADYTDDVTWFASTDTLDRGHSYRVRATVKKHGEYRGRPQTVVNRIHVSEEL